MLNCLRSIPNLLTIRPADAIETEAAYEVMTPIYPYLYRYPILIITEINDSPLFV
jgi:transketolase